MRRTRSSPPHLRSRQLSPTSGTTAGGTAVTITGTNLAAATAVDFGTTAGTVTADTATSITVTSPAEAAGAVQVTVDDRRWDEQRRDVHVLTGHPDACDHGTEPDERHHPGGTAVTITGTNLASATAVDFGTTAGTVTADTATSITVTSPAEAAGAVERDRHDGRWDEQR